jgi:formylglycine-generating enzyme required for sulfatase activity
LTQGFWMGKYELTKAQWTAVMGTTPWARHELVLDDPDSPAVDVSWFDAQSFITTLNSLTGKAFRLPSEAEWEYACRAGTTDRFYWGDDPDYTVGNDYAWWKYNTFDVDEDYAHVVGQNLPNSFGLYDMSGNVWEWCNDWYDDYPDGSVTDPTGPTSPPGPFTGPPRVVRGGSWYTEGLLCRSAARSGSIQTRKSARNGFRLSRSVGPDESEDEGEGEGEGEREGEREGEGEGEGEDEGIGEGEGEGEGGTPTIGCAVGIKATKTQSWGDSLVMILALLPIMILARNKRSTVHHD